MRKKVYFIITLLMLIFPFTASANRFYIETEYLVPGTTATLEFVFENNGQEFFGFQSDVWLPAGVTPVRRENGELDITLTDRADEGGYSITSNILSNGWLRMGTFSTNKTPISGDGGVLVNMKVNVSPEFNGGELKIENILVVGPGYDDWHFDPFSIYLKPLVEVSEVILNTTSIELEVGGVFSLIATVLPENAADKSVSWSSNNNSVATVDEYGNITAIALGEADITASCGQVSSTCKVTVIPTPAAYIIVTPEYVELKVGESATLTAEVYPEETTDKTVTWSSANESVATVDSNGRVTALSIGGVTIVATCGDVSCHSCLVNVVPTPVESIAISNDEVSLIEGETITLIATVLPQDASDKNVIWESSNEAVAVVSDSGEVTAVMAGTAEITATASNGLTASCTVTVDPKIIAVTGIFLNTTELSLVEGETATLTVTVEPADATDKSVTWTCSDAAIATVSSAGEVTAVKAGIATITVTSSNGLTANCTVTVDPKIIAVTGISLNTNQLSLVEGEIATLTATVEPADATDKTVTWTSSDATIATVSATGEVTAVKAGTATITATTSNGLTANCTVTVDPKIIAVTGIFLNTTELSLVEGETATLTATVEPADATDKTVTWTSSDATIATVSAAGEVTAVKAGTATITATTSNGLTASCTVTVEPKIIAVTGISLNTNQLSLVEGEVATLTATVEPADATDKTVTWTSSDATIATVSAAGEVTAVKAGTATITATTSNGLTASCAVTVDPKIIAVTGITLNTNELSLVEGETASLSATVKPADATDKTVTWSSSDATIATVTAAGEVTAVKAGTATIKATTSNGLTASCTVTVEPKIIAVTGITLNTNELSLVEGETAILTATVDPADATDKTVTWSSSDATIATVSESGEVTAIMIGTALITATTSNGLEANCVVTVEPILAESLTLSPDVWTGEEGCSFTIDATILPENTTDKSLSWESSDANVATVDAEGMVNVVKAGECTIIVSTLDGSNLKAECKITGLSGIEQILSDPNTRANVFNLNGVMLKRNCTREDLKQLQPGIYILRESNGNSTVFINK